MPDASPRDFTAASDLRSLQAAVVGWDDRIAADGA